MENILDLIDEIQTNMNKLEALVNYLLNNNLEKYQKQLEIKFIEEDIL